MLTKTLNGKWKLKIIGDNVFNVKDTIDAAVPGSVYGTLLDAGLMPDPYYRDNELTALKLMENDFEYMTKFDVDAKLLGGDELLLRFDGIDTLADIYINGEYIGNAYNMHRIWEYSVSDYVKPGENELKVIIHSPVKYIRAEQEKVYTGGSSDAMEGFPHLRKAHCMFGWDWGPRLPDAGFFRDVTLVSVKEARFDSVYITQEHEQGKVTLDFDISIELFDTNYDGDTKITVTSPTGETYTELDDGKIEIANPKLWWPNGYGEQPLYIAKAELIGSDGTVLDVWEKKIGLRTMTMKREQDEWGESFAHEINGLCIFAMGADYIPEDNLFGRINKERSRKLLTDAVAANHNVIRIWGGGYYPDDYFFDLCDELGLVVWHDFMFSCASYELDDEFEANISQEVIDNVRRIRHHACLGLWCGNNEMEDQVNWNVWKSSNKQRYDYIKLYEYIIPKLVKEEDPNTFYWPSSPSCGGNFDNPQDPNRGDTHYWDVWHGNKPFTDYRNYFFRYLSEFGFQSFPSIKTIDSFAEEKDKNIFSRVMEMHQRNKAANGKILNYISATYLYPNSFENLIYVSQLLQADAIRYGVEHFRRNRGRCMGTVVWQLNDIWPVASWASIDYFGRWKALHYAEKKMFAPIMISCYETGELSERPFVVDEPKEIEKSAKLHVANETWNEVSGTVHWSLRNPDSSIIKSGQEDIKVPAFSGTWLEKMDFSEYDELSVYFTYDFTVDGKVVSEGTCLFTPPKHYKFLNPELSLVRKGNVLEITAKNFAKSVEIEAMDGDVKLSDNYFDMNAGKKEITILEGDANTFRLKSVYEIA